MKFFLLIATFIFTFSFAKESFNEKNPITVLMPQNFAPYFKLDENKEPTGFAVELFKEVAKRSNINFNIVVKPNYYEVERAFVNKKADVIMLSGISNSRKKSSLFTTKFDSSIIRAYKLRTNKINSIDEIKFNKLTLKINNIAVKLFKDFPKDKLTMVLNKEEGLISLLSKESDVFVFNEEPFNKLLTSLNLNDVIQALPHVIRKVDFAIRIQKEEVELQKRLNNALNEFLSSEEFEKLKYKYFENDDKSLEDIVSLTKDEKEYLKNKKEIILGFHTKWSSYLMEYINGKYVGIVPDFYEIIAKRLNIKFKYKIYENIKETIENVKKDKIDIIPIMSGSIAEENKFQTSKNIFTDYLYIFENKNSEFKKINSIKDLKGLKVAYADVRIRLDKYLSQYKDSIEFVKTNTSLDAFLLLQNNEVDVVIDKYSTNYLLFENFLQNDIKATYLIKELLPDSAVAITSKDPLLKSIITKAISSITFLEQQYIINKWLSLYDNKKEEKIQLSLKEKEYLEKNNEFTVCNQYDVYPISGVKNNKLVGIMGDIYKCFEEELNINFKVIESINNDDFVKKVKDNTCDFVSVIDKKGNRFKNIISSETILESHLASMGNIKSVAVEDLSLLKNQTILVKFEELKKKINRVYPNLNIEVVRDINEIIKRIKNDSKTYLIATKPIIDRYINKYGFDKFKTNGIYEDFSLEFATGVNSDNTILLGIINKVIKSLDDSFLNNIIDNHTIKEFRIEKSYNIYLIYTLVFLSILIFLIFFRNRVLNEKLKLQKELQEVKEKQLKQEVIKKERDKLNITQHIAKVGSFTYETNGDKYWCSKEFCNIMDFDLKENITKDKELLKVHKNDRVNFENFINATPESKITRKIVYKIITKKGEKYIERYCSFNSIEKICTGVILDITEKVLAEKDKEQRELVLLNQSKLASLGEMIGNISQQWREPLSVITVASSGIKLQNEAKILSDDILYRELDLINENCYFLSDTIETFRNYIETSKELKEVVLQETIKNTLGILSASLKNSYIKLIHNLDEVDNIKINLIPGELSQVLMNIITNAKDILVENKVSNPLIKLTLENENGKIKISIKDNAGGIPHKIFSKIFEAYFTTKYKSEGTGLGLYMSHQIVTQQLNGNIDVENVNFIHNNVEYKGAEFIISFDVR